ncbi:eosinophil granule major basic protein 2-like [Protopterus annectens]|uniref:eosinophil granule major basic protein 2-like n=1 Tax=Protopterus annectens TaxID=7888 RepID=UPI001CFA432B|nr:eosinophil granule major basic protein 2-like [Protopterus annectens]
MKAILVFLILLVVAESILSAPNEITALSEAGTYSMIFEGVTYTLYSSPLTFAQAEASCTRTGYNGHLVSIHSHSLNLFLLHMVRHFNVDAHQMWIGGKRNSFRRKFYWTDGSRWNYWYWGSGSPSGPGYHQNCVVMSTTNPGYWHDIFCSYKRPYICEH